MPVDDENDCPASRGVCSWKLRVFSNGFKLYFPSQSSRHQYFKLMASARVGVDDGPRDNASSFRPVLRV